jgi:hypothetical protein
MPTIRRSKKRGEHRRVTPAAIEAWRGGDYRALHNALHLAPFEMSPLPRPFALGCDPDNHRDDGTVFSESWEQARDLQRQLYELAGPPDLRAEYERQIADAQEMAAYYEGKAADINYAGTGFGDPEAEGRPDPLQRDGAEGRGDGAHR